jgi:MarR family
MGRALHGLMTAAVRSRPRERSLTSLSTLAILDRTGPRRITDLAACESMMQPSVTGLVNALERSGLVERRTDTPTDALGSKRLGDGDSPAGSGCEEAGIDSVRNVLVMSMEGHDRPGLALLAEAIRHGTSP